MRWRETPVVGPLGPQEVLGFADGREQRKKLWQRYFQKPETAGQGRKPLNESGASIVPASS